MPAAQFVKAITRSQYPILILRGNTVIGKGKWITAMDHLTSLEITEGEAFEITKKLSEEGEGNLPSKWYNPRYDEITGLYQPRLGWDSLNASFGNTRAVSEFELRYGMVPKEFAEVEGYRSALEKIEGNSRHGSLT